MAPTLPPSCWDPAYASLCFSSSLDHSAYASSRGDEPAVDSYQKPCHERWFLHDEVKILKALAGHRRKGEKLPTAPELFSHFGDGADFMREEVTKTDLSKKMYNLRKKFKEDLAGKDFSGYLTKKQRKKRTLRRLAARGAPPPERDRHRNKMIFRLSTKVWPEEFNNCLINRNSRLVPRSDATE